MHSENDRDFNSDRGLQRPRGPEIQLSFFDQPLLFAEGGGQTSMNWSEQSLYFLPESEPKTSRFFGISVLLHLVLGLSATLIQLPELMAPDTQTIEFEFLGPLASPPSSPKIAEPKVAAPKTKIVSQTSRKPTEKARSVPPQRAQAIQKQASTEIAPTNLDDIQVPDLKTDFSRSVPAAQFDDKDLNSNFDAIDQNHEKQVLGELNQLNNLSKKLEQGGLEALDRIEAANRESQARIAQVNSTRRNQELAQAKSILAAQASKGRGTDLVGKAAGSGKKIRKIEDLKQMPGNPKPTYSSAERKRGEEGQTRILGYVTAQGSLEDLKILGSSGYVNLDRKALLALKGWKFFPGQEGWVEVPIQWELVGGAQEAPTLLRRK